MASENGLESASDEKMLLPFWLLDRWDQFPAIGQDLL